MEKLPQPAAKPETEPAKEEAEKMWLVVNRLFRAFPFATADGRIRIYRDRAAAQRYIDHKKEHPLAALSLTETQLDRCMQQWRKLGIKSVDIYSDDEKFTTMKTTDTNHIGDMLALLMLRIKQNTVRKGDRNFLAMDYDWLKKELAAVPVLVPVEYAEDQRRNAAKDTAIHTTEGANVLLSALLRDEDNQPRNPIPSYFGTKLLTGDRFGVIWNGDKIIYYGGVETALPPRPENNADNGGKNRVMHGFFADNVKTGAHMLAAFTNMEDLRTMFPEKRVALFTFRELAALAVREGDGVVFDPGATGLCFEMDHAVIEKLL